MFLKIVNQREEGNLYEETIAVKRVSHEKVLLPAEQTVIAGPGAAPSEKASTEPVFFTEWLYVSWEPVVASNSGVTCPDGQIQVKTGRSGIKRPHGEGVDVDFPNELGFVAQVYLMGPDGQTIERIQ